MRLQTLRWFGLILLASTGCLVVPQEAEVTVEPGAERVEVLVVFRDVRLATGDLVDGLRIFSGVADLEVARRYFVKSHMATWGCVLTGVTWRARGQVLDMEARGHLPRSTFESCATAQCGDAAVPEDARCRAFPIAKCGGEYSTTYPGQSLHPTYRLMSPGQWPADSRRLTGTLVIDENDKAAKLPSGLPVFTHYARSPEAARETLQRMERFQLAYMEPRVADAAKLFVEARSASDWLAVEDANRERMTFLFDFLASHRAHLLSRPPGLFRGVRFGMPDPPPFETPMPELLRLRLQVAYEAALRGMTDNGRLTNVDRYLAEVCTAPEVQRNAKSRRWCDQLMLRGPEGWVLETWATPRRRP